MGRECGAVALAQLVPKPDERERSRSGRRRGIPVGVDLEDGVRLITAMLKRHRPQPRMRSRKSS